MEVVNSSETSVLKTDYTALYHNMATFTTTAVRTSSSAYLFVFVFVYSPRSCSLTSVGGFIISWSHYRSSGKVTVFSDPYRRRSCFCGVSGLKRKQDLPQGELVKMHQTGHACPLCVFVRVTPKCEGTMSHWSEDTKNRDKLTPASDTSVLDSQFASPLILCYHRRPQMAQELNPETVAKDIFLVLPKKKHVGCD
jgi:hypothetical protein